MDDAFAQEVEAGAAVHLSLDRLEPVDVALGGAGAVGQGEPSSDGSQVVADPGGKGLQFGPVVGFHALSQLASSCSPVRRVIILAKLVACSARRSSWAQWPRR